MGKHSACWCWLSMLLALLTYSAQMDNASVSQALRLKGHRMDDTEDKIAHLMACYHWSYWEALEYFYYEPYDPSDWYDTQWEKP